ncbi:MAG TPA: amidohydrolase family protein [Pyrinomonadaceae bacterium]|nr:amidohydrolase family protein [Pyrinomonadaceae bacterium]
MTDTTRSAEIRSRLTHPVIDADGHMIEFEAGVLDYLHQVGGRSLVDRFNSWGAQGLFNWHRLSAQERREKRVTRGVWWGLPARNTLDRATASLPKLLHERLEQFGIDFAILYPTLGLPVAHIEDEELRRGASRAFNSFYADIYREYADRLTPAAIIPMHTPQEAIEELEYAVKTLGLKAFMFPSHVRRPIPDLARKCPDAARQVFYLDTYGIDSDYDYDSVWTTCVELKVAPTFHSSGYGWGSRTSPSNFIYNRIGHFAAAGEALCKSLFMGGVTKRFPNLKFAFLECGVGWACNLYSDLFGHWEKRNRESLEHYNPANLNRDLLVDLHVRYGGKMVAGKLDQLKSGVGLLEGDPEDETTLDEWAHCRIERAEEIRDLFISSFYFGGEADDPITAWAFNTKVNPMGARLKALFSSDIGHWDVQDMTDVLAEAYELVEKELITEADFEDFVFTNPVSFYTGINPDFFTGTAVEKAAKRGPAAHG